MAGGVGGEAFVANVEDIGSFGDVFEAGPTQLEETTDEGGREDAGRKLMNRVKVWCRESGDFIVWLWCRESNQSSCATW